MEKNEKVSIKYDAFVKAVRPDPKSTENTVYLEGFIGESSVPNHFRLYSDASLNDFVEIPTDAVIHSVAHSKEESPLGGSKLWVKQDAIYTYGNPAMTNRPQGSFFEGDLYQGYMDSMYQPDASGAGADMGAMGGGISQPITGCINPIPKTILCPVASRIVVCATKFCPSKLICPTRFCPSKLICPTFGACPSIACNPGGGGRPFDGSQGMTDPSGGSFNPYFDGDLYQGYMDSMYQPQADATATQGDFMQATINPVVCGGTILPLSVNPAICPPRKSLFIPCPTNVKFPPCNFPQTKPWFPPCNGITKPWNTICRIPTLVIFCNNTGGNVPVKSIADCPSFPCPTTGPTTVINPGGNVGHGAMSDPSGGSFNPYFDGDLYQGYMDSMYQPDASGAGNTGAMGGGMENMASFPLCTPITLSAANCPIRSLTVICNEPSRFIICTRGLSCITRDRRISLCIRCIPVDWTRFDPTTPVFNPGRINPGGQQFGGDFYGSFDPYSGY